MKIFIIFQIISILWITWSFKLVTNNTNKVTNNTNKTKYKCVYTYNDFLKHLEDEKSILNSSVCSFGIMSGYVIIMWTFITIILMYSIKKMNNDKYKKKKITKIIIFTINIIFLILITLLTFIMNYPLFVRTIPYLLIQIYINYLIISFSINERKNIKRINKKKYIFKH